MEDPKYNQEPEYEYDDYEYDYDEPPQPASLGLPPGQLALIIGVNAVLSLIISIAVVLIAGRSNIPSDVTALVGGDEGTTETEAEANAPPTGEDVAADLEPVAGISTQSAQVDSVDYTVEGGDTLSSIASKFSVSVFDIMVANGLTDEDFIQAGQSLVIPLGGLPTATPTFTVVPLPTDTPLPFDPPTPIPTGAEIPPEPAATVGPSPSPTNTPIPPSPTPIPTSTPPAVEEINIVVNEIIGAGDLGQETVVILNQGAGTSLKDWTLEGSNLGIFLFPDVFLFSGGSIRIHTGDGENTASDLYLGQENAAWEPDSVIILNDNKNSEISRFTVPAN